MITITDVPGGTPPYWEVVDSTGKTIKVVYNPNCPTGYDRVSALKQIVDIYSIQFGCTKQGWQTPGTVFILS
jgi:hypothetical protein